MRPAIMADEEVDESMLESCDVCGADHDTELCPELGLDKSADETQELSRARLTLPHNLMALEHAAGEGVAIVAMTDIPAKTQFGPFEAKRSTNDLPLDNYFVLKVLGRDGKNVLLDTSDENECNWLCLVRTAMSPSEQNCMAYQLGVNIFYNTTRRIQSGQELRVWYAAHYAKKLGRSPQSDSKTKIMLGSNVGDLLSTPVKVEPLDRGDEPMGKRRRTMRSNVQEFLMQARQKHSKREPSSVKKPEKPARKTPAKKATNKAPPKTTAKTTLKTSLKAMPKSTPKATPTNRRRSSRNRTLSAEEETIDEPPAAEEQEPETGEVEEGEATADLDVEEEAHEEEMPEEPEEEDEEMEEEEDSVEGGEYRCPRCPKAFASQGVMVRHLRSHIKSTKSPGTPVRTLFCSLCHAGFVNASNMNRHMKTHNRSVNLIQCPHCNYKTYRHDIMRTHAEARHGCDYATPPRFARTRSKVIKKEVIDDHFDEMPQSIEETKSAQKRNKTLKKETLSALQLKQVPGKRDGSVKAVSTPTQTPSGSITTPRRVMPSRRNRGKKMLEALSPSKRGKTIKVEEEEGESSEEEIIEDSEDEWKEAEVTEQDGDLSDAENKAEGADIDVVENGEEETNEVVGRIHIKEDHYSASIQAAVETLALLVSGEPRVDGEISLDQSLEQSITEPGEVGTFGLEPGEVIGIEPGEIRNEPGEVGVEPGEVGQEAGKVENVEAGEVTVAETDITKKPDVEEEEEEEEEEENKEPVVKRGRPRKGAKPSPIPDFVDVFVTQDNRNIYGCNDCGKKFQSLKYVRVHHTVHSKKFNCEKCGKFFSKKEKMEKHTCTSETVPVTMVVEGDRVRFRCTECGKFFANEDYARQHYSIHSGVFSCKICNQRFYSKPGLSNHKCNKEEVDKKVFPCDICHQTFRTSHYLYRHLAMHTDIFKCNICGKCFSRKDSMQRHVLRCDPVRALKEDIHACINCNKAFSSCLALDNHKISCYQNFCDVCKQNFNSEEELEGHNCQPDDNRLVELGGRVNCKECGKSFCNLKYLKRHEAAHNGAFQCEICEKAFSRKEELIWHSTMCEAAKKVKEHGFVKCDHCEEDAFFDEAKSFREHFIIHTHPFKCDTCGKRFRKQGTIHTHKCDPDQYRPEGFKCPHCEKTFKLKMGLDNHIVVHGEKLFECEVCNKKFFRKDYINDHQCLLEDGTKARVIRRHNRVVVKENVVCHLCGRSFVSASNMNKHLKTHGEKQYACDVCGKKFHYQAYLKDHKFHVHGGGIKLQCSQCGKIMKTKTSLKSHLLHFHSDSAPMHPCPTCGKIFRQKGNLKTHMFSHTKEKLFHCNICDKSFKYPDQFNRHKLEHTMTNKINCELCEKKFVKMFEYRKHMAVFHSGMAYLCDICNARCSHRHTLIRHFKRKHPGAVGLLQQENYVDSLLTPLKQTEARRMTTPKPAVNNTVVSNTYVNQGVSFDSHAITTEATTAATMSIGQTFTNELGETFAESVITDADGNETTIVYQTPEGFNIESNLPQLAAEALQSLSHTIMTTEDLTHVQFEVQDSEQATAALQLADIDHDFQGDDQQTVVILQIVDEDSEQIVETIVQ